MTNIGPSNPYRSGFSVDSPIDSILDEEWIFSEKYSTEDKLVFQGYDANLCPMTLFSSWPDSNHKSFVIKTALERTKDFPGEVWLDDIRIDRLRGEELPYFPAEIDLEENTLYLVACISSSGTAIKKRHIYQKKEHAENAVKSNPFNNLGEPWRVFRITAVEEVSC